MNSEARMYPEFDTETNDGGRSAFEQLDLQHYLRTLRKYRFPIVAFTLATTLLAAYYAYSATPIFRANTTLLIEDQKANVVSIEELYGVESANEDYYQTQYELLKSRSLAERVVNDLDLWNDPLFSSAAAVASADARSEPVDAGLASDATPGVLDQARGALDSLWGLLDESPTAPVAVVVGEEAEDAGVAEVTPTMASLSSDAVEADSTSPRNSDPNTASVVNRFLSRLSIDPVRRTKLVKIGYESPDPVQAALIANAVAENYIENHLEARMEMTTRASSWLAGRVGQLKEVLDESEQRLIEYKLANGLVDVGGSVGRLNEQEILLLTAELAQARNSLSDVNDLYREIQSIGAQPVLLEKLPAIQANGIVQSVKLEQGAAQRKLDELLNRYGNSHPRVIDARSGLSTLDLTLAQTIQRVVGGIENDFRLQRQRVASLESQIRSGKSEIQGLGSKKFELDALAREVETNRNLYNQFFSRMTEARSADGLEAANARIADFAEIPGGPIKPNKQLIIALAALASLVLSILMAILYEQMDDSVSNTRDVESELGLPLLGILPLIKQARFSRNKDEPLNPMSIRDPKNTYKEAVNTVRTAVLGTDLERSPKVILVTSSIPGEGKSTAALSLAFSLARVERVLLIDCDLRKPTVGRVLGLPHDAPGVANVITGKVRFSEALQRGAFDGAMDVLSSGPSPDQPLELLSSPRLGLMIDKLRTHYDRIIIDSAPTQAVSDAIVLSRLSDATVYVIKSHDTGMDLARRGLQRLKTGGATIAGAVVTQVDIAKLATYGGDYHYQGYYDYYGYGEDKVGGKDGVMRLQPEELRELRRDPGVAGFELGGSFETSPRQADVDLGDAGPPVQLSGNSHEVPLSQRRKPPGGKRRFVDAQDLDIL